MRKCLKHYHLKYDNTFHHIVDRTIPLKALYVTEFSKVEQDITQHYVTVKCISSTGYFLSTRSLSLTLNEEGDAI